MPFTLMKPLQKGFLHNEMAHAAAEVATWPAGTRGSLANFDDDAIFRAIEIMEARIRILQAEISQRGI